MEIIERLSCSHRDLFALNILNRLFYSFNITALYSDAERHTDAHDERVCKSPVSLSMSIFNGKMSQNHCF